MSNRILNLIFKADASQATKELDKLKGEPGSGGTGGSGISGVSSALAFLNTPAVIGAIGAAGLLVKNQNEDWREFNENVANLAASLGISTDEAGWLFAEMEKANIGESAVITAFQNMSKEGIEPTLDNLFDLLEKWEAMPAGADKGIAAMEAFGSQGIAQLIPWWEGLTQAEKDAVGEGLKYIDTSPEVIQAAADQQAAIDDLTLIWQGLWSSIMVDGAPALTALLEQLTEVYNMWTGIAENAGKIRDFLATGPNATGLQGMTGGRGLESSVSVDPRSRRSGSGGRGFAAGGSFQVGGAGGPDSTPVGFMATPGETVTVGGGTSDMENIRAQIERLVDSIPLAITDAMERR